ncbi:MAG: FHA domain-containing protein [Acidimicrobiia bacterium]
MSLKVSYQGNDVVVDEGSSILIGSGEGSSIRIARPGISRQHAAVSYDGSTWKVEDADSRNGTFVDGQRIHVTTIDGPMTLFLGHPTDGESITFTPIDNSVQDLADEIDSFMLPDTPPAVPSRTSRRSAVDSAPAPSPTASAAVVAASDPPRQKSATDPDLHDAIRDQIAAIRGLTWSVWAMIAVTAALCVLTLFVGILGS